MRFEFTAEEEAFRADLCAFLQRELTPEVWHAHRDANEQGFWTSAFTKAFRRKLGAAGYIGMGWPAAYGGGRRSRIYQTIFAEEMEYHRAPGLDRSITYVPNALLAFGTEAQKAEFLPPINRGELSWFVGYSEPEAGSDLASLKTGAVPDGDTFVITGQKAFSSEAHMADYGWVAARTEPGRAQTSGHQHVHRGHEEPGHSHLDISYGSGLDSPCGLPRPGARAAVDAGGRGEPGMADHHGRHRLRARSTGGARSGGVPTRPTASTLRRHAERSWQPA